MNLTTSDSYRLGYMPRRVFDTLPRFRSPEDADFAKALGLTDDWLGLLSRLKVPAVTRAVTELRDRLQAEREYPQALRRFEARRFYLRLERERDPSTPAFEGDAPELPAGANGVEISRRLLDPQLQLSVRECLPAELQELHELGDLVARCHRQQDLEEWVPVRVWTIAQRLGIESWVTGMSAGANVDIQQTVLDQCVELDELLLTQGVEPLAVERPVPVGPYLTIAEAAALLQVGEDTVERLINSGQLVASEISGKGREAGRKFKRIRREAIDTFLKQAEKSPQPAAQPLRRRKRADHQKDYFES